VVCEPTVRARLEIPAGSMGTVIPTLGRLGAAVESSSARADLAVVEAVVAAARANDLQRELPRITAGEGVLETTFAGYQPVTGARRELGGPRGGRRQRDRPDARPGLQDGRARRAARRAPARVRARRERDGRRARAAGCARPRERRRAGAREPGRGDRERRLV